MKTKILSVISVAILLYSCNKSSSPAVYDYEVYKTQELMLEKEDIGGYYTLHEQLVNIDGKDVLILNIQDSHLAFYDLESGNKIHDILVDTTYQLNDYYYIGKDSIFVSSHNNQRDFEIKSPRGLRLIDYEGNIKVIYGYNLDTVEVTSFGYTPEDITPPYFQFVFCRGNVIPAQTYVGTHGLLGTKESIENQLPLGIRLDTKENKYHVSKHKKYPYIKEGEYYPSYVFSYINKSIYNLPLYRYQFSSTIFEWDFENDKLIEHILKSKFFDTIMPLDCPTEQDYNLPYSYSGWIIYDQCNDIYINPVMFNEKIYGERRTSAILADKDFNYLGEIYNTKIYPRLSNKSIAIDAFPKNDSVVLIKYLKLVKTNRDYDKYIDSCKLDLQTMKQSVVEKRNSLINGCPSINFVKSQMDIKESSYKILTLYGEGCIGCEYVTLQALYENREVLNKVPLYIIVSSRNAKEFEAYMKYNGLTYYDKLAKDTTGIMKSLANCSELLNPRITVVEDGIVTLDTIYQALDIEDKLLPQIIGPDEHSRYVLDKNGEVIVTTKQ